MKISIIGYGKMGKQIEALALERCHTIHSVIAKESWLSNDIEGADVAIEFSRPEAALVNIRKCFQANVPVVIGTTGWYDNYDYLKAECLKNNNAMLAATNFSLGVNIFFEINKKLASLMSNTTNYENKITETHHLEKLDQPSGTAISLAEQLIANNNAYKKWKIADDSSDEGMVNIHSYRKPAIPGTHQVIYESEVDEIVISHEAKNRKGFALGAILAAEFLAGKKGVFSMKQVLGIQ